MVDKVVKRTTFYVIKNGTCHSSLLLSREGTDIQLLLVVLHTTRMNSENHHKKVWWTEDMILISVALAYALAETLKLGSTVESLAMRYQRSTLIRNQLKILDMPLELHTFNQPKPY